MFPVPHFDWFCALVRSTSRLLSAGVLICRSGVVVAVAALPYGVSFQCGAVDTAFFFSSFLWLQSSLQCRMPLTGSC